MAEQKSGHVSGSPNIVVGAMILGAGIFAAMGTWMPGAIGFTGSDAILMRVILYGMAAADVAVALFLRSRIRQAQRDTAAKAGSGGTIQRQ